MQAIGLHKKYPPLSLTTRPSIPIISTDPQGTDTGLKSIVDPVNAKPLIFSPTHTPYPLHNNSAADIGLPKMPNDRIRYRQEWAFSAALKTKESNAWVLFGYCRHN